MSSVVLLIIALLFPLISHSHFLDRPDGHAPIGVMADHGHKEGEVMVSYRLMLMKMEDMLSGSNNLTSDDLFSTPGFMMAPTQMDMWMHMLGVMYGINDKLTVSTMIPYLSNSMTMKRRMQGDEIKGKSNGIGDISFNTLYTLCSSESSRLLVSLGLFVPTGSISENNNGMRQGYPMQLGSGSYALQPAITYSQSMGLFSIGSQLGSKLFLNENGNGYTLGSRYFANIWGAWMISNSLSSSLRLSHETRDPIGGFDPSMNSAMTPVTRNDLQHGNVSSAHLGLNYYGQTFLKGHRLALEIGAPFIQDLSGPQMKQTLVSTIGWQKVF